MFGGCKSFFDAVDGGSCNVVEGLKHGVVNNGLCIKQKFANCSLNTLNACFVHWLVDCYHHRHTGVLHKIWLVTMLMVRPGGVLMRGHARVWSGLVWRSPSYYGLIHVCHNTNSSGFQYNVWHGNQPWTNISRALPVSNVGRHCHWHILRWSCLWPV